MKIQIRITLVLLTLTAISFNSWGQEKAFESIIDGKLNKVEKFIESGGDVNTTDGNNYSLLMCAVENNQTSVVEYLIAKGADVNHSSSKGTTLHYTTKNKQIDISIVKQLVEHGASKEHEKNLIPYTLDNKRYDIVEYLIDKGFPYHISPLFNHALNKDNPENNTLIKIIQKSGPEELEISAAFLDVSRIDKFTSLKKLKVEYPGVEGFSSICKLPNIEELYISGYIEDPGPLSNLSKLKKLSINSFNREKMKVTVFPKIPSLTELDIEWSSFTDISNLKYSPNLKRLHLIYAGVNDLSELTNLSKLEYLSIPYVEDLNVIADFKNLKVLKVDSDSKDFSPLSGLINLTELVIEESTNNNLDFLSSLTNLKVLILWGSHISDIKPLSKLTNLEELHLYANDITDISPLAGLTKLSKLLLLRNKISDISALSNMTNMEYLSLEENKIVDVSSLSKLNKLKELQIEDNFIMDISVAGNWTSLEVIDLENNYIRDVSMLTKLEKLKELNIKENLIMDTDLPVFRDNIAVSNSNTKARKYKDMQLKEIEIQIKNAIERKEE